jgi:NADPH-dependent ferric siderophore reductase
VQKERKRLRAAVLVVRERGTLRPSPEQVDGLCLALDLAALKALADTLEPADVPLEVCAAALTAALEATGGGSLDDTRMSWAQRQAQQRMLAAQLQEVAAAEASERQAAVAAAKLLREEREAAAAATKLLRVGPQTVSFKDPFQTPVEFVRTVLKPLLNSGPY